MKKQSYSNHRYQNLTFTIIVFLLSLSLFTFSFLQFNVAITEGINFYIPAILTFISLILILLFVLIRSYCLRLQTRIIRAEENLRHFVLTGKLLDSRLDSEQICALRYAPDNEVIELGKEAGERQLNEEEIKKMISRWKGDYHSI